MEQQQCNQCGKKYSYDELTSYGKYEYCCECLTKNSLEDRYNLCLNKKNFPKHISCNVHLNKKSFPKSKICSRCKENKESIWFHKDKINKDGLHYMCKKCILKDSNYDKSDKVWMIYFIKCKNFIKIGRSNNINRRFKELQSANPFKIILLFIIKGNQETEQDLHIKFNKYLCRNEWFRYKGRLKKYIES